MSNKSMRSFYFDLHSQEASTSKWLDEGSVFIRISKTALCLTMPTALKHTDRLTQKMKAELLSRLVEIAARCLLEGSEFVRSADGKFRSKSSKSESESSENERCTKSVQLSLPFLDVRQQSTSSHQ